MTEQKFDSLCSFAEKLNLRITTDIYPQYIEIKVYDSLGLKVHETSYMRDEYFTKTLQYLRKISKQQTK